MTPTAPPTIRPPKMIPQLPIPSSRSVATIAITMPTAAIMLPCLAVVGWVPRRMPKMNSEKLTM